jgi:hypothetical protein
MRDMMFVATDPQPEPYNPDEDNIEEWVAKDDAAGKRVIGDRLRPVEDARIVRRRGERVLGINGPFSESREWIERAQAGLAVVILNVTRT